MVDISAIGSAISAINGIKDIAQAMIGLRDAAAVQEKRIEFQDKIIQAQQAIMAAQEERTTLVQRVDELEKQLARFKAWETEKKRYELKEVDVGAFVYALKGGVASSEPPHWLCAHCYEAGNKSILQRAEGLSIYDVWWRCPDCRAAIRVGARISPTNRNIVE